MATLALFLTISEIQRRIGIKTHIFLTLTLFNPKFENVLFARIAKILPARSCDTGLINRVKSFSIRFTF